MISRSQTRTISPEKYKDEEERLKSRGMDSMIPFTGDDRYLIKNWIAEFEDTAKLMEWSDVEKLIYGKRLLAGTAKLFLRTTRSVKSWETLKTLLLEEFTPKLNSAMIHKQLASRKMKNEETCQQYLIHMKELSLHTWIEDTALMVYVIDGIRDDEINKAMLYGAKNLNEFKFKLDCYEKLRKTIEQEVEEKIPSFKKITMKDVEMIPLKDTESDVTSDAITEEKNVHEDYTMGDSGFSENVENKIEEHKPTNTSESSNIEMTEEYDYETEHKPGITIKHADAFSRHPVCLIVTETTPRSKKAQEDDLQIQVIKKILEKEPYKDLQNGVFTKEKDGRKIIMVQKKKQYEIIRGNHKKGRMNLSIEKTEKINNPEYFNEGLKIKISKVIDNCIKRIVISHKRRKKKGYLRPLTLWSHGSVEIWIHQGLMNEQDGRVGVWHILNVNTATL